MKHKKVLKDWKYLWSIGPASDMTGGYVDQYDLNKLLEKPSKETATECLISQMDYWFTVGPDLGKGEKISTNGLQDIINNDIKVQTIKEEYGF